MSHGHTTKHTHSRTYTSWAAMIKRCTNPKCAGYHLYGGRGIAVCDSWKKFANFLADMGVRPEGMSIDRIDVDKGYFKDNCKWSTSAEQQRNRRDSRKFTYQGLTLNLKDWSDRTGIHADTLRNRLKKKWPLTLVFTVPATSGNSVMRKSRIYPTRNDTGQFQYMK